MGLDRRSFISLVAGGVVGSLATPVVWKTLDDVSIWSQNWPWIPRLQYGEETLVPSVCKLGTDAYGVRVKLVAGRPVAAYGNPEHPLSQGGICPLGAASVQMLYSPSRIKNPKKRVGDSFQDISWEEAEALVVEQLKAAGSSVALVTADETGSAAEVLAGLVASLGSDQVYCMPSEGAVAAAALGMLGGDGLVGYDLEGASYVLLLGADALGAWGNTLRNAKVFGASRQRAVRFVYVGPALTPTAAVADAWIPCAPGTEGIVAMGLAALVLETAAPAKVNGLGELRNQVAPYTPEAVAARTGVPAQTLQGLAKELVNAGKPLVIPGTTAGQGLGLRDAMAALGLNVLLGRINTVGGVMALPWAPKVVAAAPGQKAMLGRDLVGYFAGIAAGSTPAPKVMLVHGGANPAYAMPDLKAAQTALDKVGFLVALSSFMDETAAKAHLILPESLTYERYDDAYTPYGSGKPNYTLAAPVLKAPLFNTKAAADVALSVASKLGVNLGFASFEEVLKAKVAALGADFEETATGAVWQGETFVPQTLSVARISGPGLGDKAAELTVVPVANLKIGSPKMATPPFGTGAISPRELQGKDMVVAMNKATAAKLGVRPGDVVTLSGSGSDIRARVRVFEGVVDGAIIAPLGLGHTAWDAFSRGKGANVFQIVSAQADAGGFSRFATAPVAVRKA
jgi:anaerobic selenocysteine-containing dehydrogenase